MMVRYYDGRGPRGLGVHAVGRRDAACRGIVLVAERDPDRWLVRR